MVKALHLMKRYFWNQDKIKLSLKRFNLRQKPFIKKYFILSLKQ